MAVKFSFSVDGVEDVVRKLQSLTPKLQAQALRKATREGAKVIQREAKALAPVQTGALRDSIKVKAGKRKKGRISTLIQVGQGDFKGDTFYGAMVEYGTRRMPARPFMTPAYESKGNAAKNVAVAEIERALERIVRGMSIGGRFAKSRVAKSRAFKLARREAKRAGKSAARLSKRARKSTKRLSKRAGKSAARLSKRAGKSTKRLSKRVGKAIRKRRI
jgi:HK97 gp10 family phage protein